MKIFRSAAPYLFLALILSTGKSLLAQAPTSSDHGKQSKGQQSSDPTFITDPIIIIKPVN